MECLQGALGFNISAMPDVLRKIASRPLTVRDRKKTLGRVAIDLLQSAGLPDFTEPVTASHLRGLP